jgi:hypothetical protein
VVLLAACASASSSAPLSATLTADGQSSATLRVLTGTRVLKIDMANLSASGALVRVSTPAGGSVFTTPGWAPGATGFDVDATAGAARVTVATGAS